MNEHGEYLQLKASDCRNCYKCIRHCPVKSIRFSGNRAHIIENECILCGTCYVVCPQNAKQIRSDIGSVKNALASGCKVVASIAPSFAAAYSGVGIENMEKALQKLGFYAAEETALGAEAVKTQYEKIMLESNGGTLISSCCPTINMLIEKYYPDLLPMLAHIRTPLSAHCKMIKEKYPDAFTVFIGPCISKKSEADKDDVIDAAITFDELQKLLEENNITPEIDKNCTSVTKSALFPTVGGIIRSMNKDKLNEYSFISYDGVESCKAALDDLRKGGIKSCFIEMSACKGSCSGGPVTEKNEPSPVRAGISIEKYAGKGNALEKMLPPELMEADYPAEYLENIRPSEKQITEILEKMGKHSPDDEFNCGSCGYNTCREKAAAVFRGKADFTMCLPYLKAKAESFSDNIINNTPNGITVLNEDFEVQLINKSACRMMKISAPTDVLGSPVIRILDPTPYMDVLNERRNVYEKKTYIAEYDLCVEETILYDRSYHIIISIMRDVTSEEKTRTEKENTRRQAVEITDKVIDKQMRVVQEIASLLGETTAETKIALTNLKEKLNDE